MHDSRPKRSKLQADNAKFDTNQNFECSFGYMDMPLQMYNTQSNHKSKLSEMLIKCAENSSNNDRQSSSTPVENEQIPEPVLPPKPIPKNNTKSRKDFKRNHKSIYERCSYKNEWNRYGSSFTEYPSHLFKPVSNGNKHILNSLINSTINIDPKAQYNKEINVPPQYHK